MNAKNQMNVRVDGHTYINHVLLESLLGFKWMTNVYVKMLI